MENLEEISLESRGHGDEGPVHLTGEEPSASPRRNRRRRRRRRNSSDSDASPLGQDLEEILENRSREWGKQSMDGPKQAILPTREDHRTKFYQMYRREAEEYDREFVKHYEEDLNTTLVFAGLFSAVTSAFIIQVQPQLQPDRNEEAATLLRVLIYKIDNTTFGNDVPTVPQWSGPPRTIVQVQAILYASLAASLLSAFLGILRKPWLAQYATTNIRGSAIERCHRRQWKFDGVITWYFDHMIESSSQVLQVALLLLCCGLSLYLWEINTTVATVIIAATSFGALFYTCIVCAGAAYTSCPYQTPGAHLLRYTNYLIRIVAYHVPSLVRTIPQRTLRIVRTVADSGPLTIGNSVCAGTFVRWRNELRGLGRSARGALMFLAITLLSPILLPMCLAIDTYLLMQATARAFISLALPRGQYGSVDARPAVLDLRCISWMLSASLDKYIHLLTLKFLATTATVQLDPGLVSTCFDILVGCVSTDGDKVVATEESESLTEASVLGFLHILSCLATVNPTSTVLDDVQELYIRKFPSRLNVGGLPSHHYFSILHNLLHPWGRSRIQWEDFDPSRSGHVAISSLVQYRYRHYQRAWPPKVPRWALRFAFHYLSQDPLPPPSVVIDCLLILAIDLGCTVPNTASLDESVQVDEVSHLITEKLEDMVRVEDPYQIWSKRKAIAAFFPYAVWPERSGEHRTIDAFLGIAKATAFGAFMRVAIEPLFNRASPRTIVLASPYAPWHRGFGDGNAVARWAAAASELPYTEELGRNVVDTLLHIASVDSLGQQIPIEVWTWLNIRPSLPPVCFGRSLGTGRNVVRLVRELGDIVILESYFLVVWSEWDYISDVSGLAEMQTSIREDFNGTRMGYRRNTLVKRLDHVLGQLDRGVGYLEQYKPRIVEYDVERAKGQYERLKDTVLEVEMEATGILIRSHSTFFCALPLL